MRVARQRGGLDEDQRREQRRQALLDAALELFARRGYLSTPIEELCRTAHVSTKSFYGVYDSREACYLDLMRRTTERLLTGMAEAVTQESFDDPADGQRRLVEALAHLMADDPRGAVVLFGRGTATTFAVEAERRANRRRSAELVTLVWTSAWPDIEVLPGVATGAVGGLFDVVADWVADTEDLTTLDPAVLETRLQAYYAVLMRGLHNGKDDLSLSL